MPGGIASRGSTSASAPGSANSVGEAARPLARGFGREHGRDQRRLRVRLAQVDLAEAEQRAEVDEERRDRADVGLVGRALEHLLERRGEPRRARRPARAGAASGTRRYATARASSASRSTNTASSQCSGGAPGC